MKKLCYGVKYLHNWEHMKHPPPPFKVNTHTHKHTHKHIYKTENWIHKRTRTYCEIDFHIKTKLQLTLQRLGFSRLNKRLAGVGEYWNSTLSIILAIFDNFEEKSSLKKVQSFFCMEMKKKCQLILLAVMLTWTISLTTFHKYPEFWPILDFWTFKEKTPIEVIYLVSSYRRYAENVLNSFTVLPIYQHFASVYIFSALFGKITFCDFMDL